MIIYSDLFECIYHMFLVAIFLLGRFQSRIKSSGSLRAALSLCRLGGFQYETSGIDLGVSDKDAVGSG